MLDKLKAARSMSHWGTMLQPAVSFVVVLVTFVAVIALGTLFPAATRPVLIALAVAIILIVATNILVYRRRIEWRDSLPFELSDYPKVHVYSQSNPVSVVVRFENAPPRSVLEDVLGNCPVPTTVDEYGEGEGKLKVDHPNAWSHRRNAHRRWLDRWLRHTIDELLIPLHREYGIRCIEPQGSRPTWTVSTG